MKISEKARAIPPFLVMEVMERAQALESRGIDVVHMEVGEPDFDTPGAVIGAAMGALEEGKTHYTHSMGRIELREGIARYYGERYGVDVSPDRIIVTSGSSPALLLVFMALCDMGDEIILTNPHYACYPSLISFGHGRPVFVDVFESDGFQYRPESIQAAITPATRAILANSPSNPTGNLLSPDSMRKIAGLGVPVVSDEIYHGLVYEGRAHSILEFTDDAIVVNGFSKLFAMTGWRLGYAVVPENLVRPIQKMQQNFFISASDFAQVSALAALFDCDDELEHMRQEYDRRRRLVLRRLREIGLAIPAEPQGAFYVFCNMKKICKSTGMDSYGLAFDILERAHLAVTPGTDFGPGGEGYVRLCYATDYDRIEEGMNRLEAYLEGLA